MKFQKNFLFVLVILISLLLSACGAEAPTAAPQTNLEPQVQAAAAQVARPTEETVDDTMLPVVDPLSVTGNIAMAGSSTVFPLAERMAERFSDEGYAGLITIDSIGSGAGFERFCVVGESDISNASRAIRDSEVESCLSIGREPVEFRIATDALAIVVSADNDFVDSLTFEQLAAIYSGAAATWADVDANWPAEPIRLFSPGNDSGTFDYFVEEIFDSDEAPILNAPAIQLSEDDNVLVQGVIGSPYAIGYFGYAYYTENADTLKVLSIEGVEPRRENVDNGSYPLARPLLIYADPAIMADKPQVAAFINFLLTYVNEEVVAVGYFPAPVESLERAKQTWLDSTGR